MPFTRSLLVVALFASTLRADEARRESWSQWRGPSRDGRIEAPAWPDSLAEERLSRVWRVELGPSYSAPIVSGDRVFVTETRDGRQEVVRALDRTTGEELWSQRWNGAMTVPFFAASNGSWIRSTPMLADNRLYVAGIRDVLVCLDADTGAIVWRRDFVADEQSPVPAFGCVSSPLVVGSHVYVQAGGAFLKLEAGTGKTVWKGLADGGGMNGSAFSSPILAELAGREQLVVQTRTELAGVDPLSGAVLWSETIPAFRGMNILTPTVAGDRVFTSSYGGGTFAYDVSESTNDGTPSVGRAWKTRTEGYMSSPVVVGQCAYLHLRNQRMTCIDLSTGESTWTSPPFGRYWSIVANGERLLALDERGELLLIAADPKEFRLLDRRRIASQPTWAHLAIIGDELFVRELNAMTVLRWR